MEYLQSAYLSLPKEPGVYLFLDKENSVIYVGKAKNLKDRVSSYFTSSNSLLNKTLLLVSKIKKIRVIVVNSEIEALLLEANLIKKYNPFYNSRLRDGKTYPFIKITKDNYPKVLLSRKSQIESIDDNSLYFGPYPNSGALKMVLKTIRRIFPFQGVENHPKRKCLYYHLNLCPCPPLFDSKEFKKEYKRNISHIIQFLSGKMDTVLKNLEKERDKESKEENFEKAKKIQEQITAVKFVTSKVNSPFEYELNPNLKNDLKEQELSELKTILNNNGVLVKDLKRIECFDISNISGKFATGSMVVFINGEKETSFYRRFKIIFSSGEPNDFKMMQEVIQRRLRHKEWELPSLFIVDGGKGQISSFEKILRENNISIPLIGLAKRDEIIITADFKEIKLPKSSKSLQLLQRIRDEAHRFAINYHRKLRSQFINL